MNRLRSSCFGLQSLTTSEVRPFDSKGRPVLATKRRSRHRSIRSLQPLAERDRHERRDAALRRGQRKDEHDRPSAEKFSPPVCAGVRHRVVRVVRDYAMFDRRESPQYYPAIQTGTAPPGANS